MCFKLIEDVLSLHPKIFFFQPKFVDEKWKNFISEIKLSLVSAGLLISVKKPNFVCSEEKNFYLQGWWVNNKGLG